MIYSWRKFWCFLMRLDDLFDFAAPKILTVVLIHCLQYNLTHPWPSLIKPYLAIREHLKTDPIFSQAYFKLDSFSYQDQIYCIWSLMREKIVKLFWDVYAVNRHFFLELLFFVPSVSQIFFCLSFCIFALTKFMIGE